jgi:hypothetical protein
MMFLRGIIMGLLRKECLCKIKLHVLKVINQLDLDENYTKENAIEELKQVIYLLDEEEKEIKYL